MSSKEKSDPHHFINQFMTISPASSSSTPRTPSTTPTMGSLSGPRLDSLS